MGAQRLLRESSLDELPQLINVVRGEMSLVGPRPIVPSETSRYGDRLDSYVLARPGLTGAWQISGRSDCGYDKRVKLDANYVSDWCFSTDLSILVQTVRAVIERKGSYWQSKHLFPWPATFARRSKSQLWVSPRILPIIRREQAQRKGSASRVAGFHAAQKCSDCHALYMINEYWKRVIAILIFIKLACTVRP